LFHDSNRKYKIKSYTVDNLEDLQQPVVITIVAEGTKPARKIRDILYCPAFPLAFQGKRERQDLTEREWPLNFYYPDRVIDSVRIKFDSTLSVNSVTSPAATGEYEHFSYSFTTADSEGQIMLVLDRSNQLYWLEPEEFESYSEYRDIVKKLMASQVKFSPTTP